MPQQLKVITEILSISNFSDTSNFFALDGPSMGRRWGAVWTSNVTPGMDHAWAIDGYAWEPMGSQYGWLVEQFKLRSFEMLGF